ILLLEGEFHLRNLEFKKAVGVLNKASTQEYAEEYSFRLLMLAYYYNGDRMQAIDIYINLTNYLKEYLDVGPSKITEELYLLIKSDREVPVKSMGKWINLD
ncbi:MAG TPA: bacterial transcriptional activator domain-containing protein, partial [Tissierellaceae bacterium]|nr:bacterial transcriptional activator domain-containing protein [Tissierellaceae bacterium]